MLILVKKLMITDDNISIDNLIKRMNHDIFIVIFIRPTRSGRKRRNIIVTRVWALCVVCCSPCRQPWTLRLKTCVFTLKFKYKA